MHAICYLAVLFGAVAFAAEARADAEFSSYYGGKRYDFKISQARQRSCPKWDPEKDANPPVSPAMALETAKHFIVAIPATSSVVGNPAPATTSWRFEDLALVEVSGGWAWRARFRLTPAGPSEGVWPTMDCWVLMDGTRVEPVVTESGTR